MMDKNSQKFLILANMAPLFGVLFLNWNLFAILFLYWFENVIIGYYNVQKILKAKNQNQETYKPIKKILVQFIHNEVVKAVLVAIFVVHYGLYTLAHGSAIFLVFFEKPESYYGIIIGMLMLFFSHGYSFHYNYIARGEYKNYFFLSQMFRPYKRVLVMGATLFLGGWIIMIFGQAKLAVFALVIAKIAIDYFSHSLEHNFIKIKQKHYKNV